GRLLPDALGAGWPVSRVWPAHRGGAARAGLRLGANRDLEGHRRHPLTTAERCPPRVGRSLTVSVAAGSVDCGLHSGRTAVARLGCYLTTTWKGLCAVGAWLKAPASREVSVPAPRSFTFRQQLTQSPPRLPNEVVLAVGARAIVRSHGDEPGRVPFAGEDDGATLADGVEVEITAWRPRRAAGALYQVRTTVGGREGWVSAS